MTSQNLESAIPEELRTVRTCPMSMKSNWTPPYPSFSARFEPSIESLGMLILGVQGDQEHRMRIHEVSQHLMQETSGVPEVAFRDQGEFTDSARMINRIIVCYFDDAEEAERAADALAAKWLASGDEESGLGFYAEQIWPTMDRVETLYSSASVQGVANLATNLSGEIQEHGYWGSARDRLPAAQTDALKASSGTHTSRGDLVEVKDIHNLCLIRSGQDWSETSGAERLMYEEEVEPVLSEGMAFLTYEGNDAGCISNRYVRVLSEHGVPTERSYGMSWWHSLKDLDDWARAHPTHKAIFRVAMRYLGEHGGSGHLKLTHEVFVIDRAQGCFQYRNCHPKTGLLSTVL